MAFANEKYAIDNNRTLWNAVYEINNEYKKYNFNSIKFDDEIYYEKRTSKAKYGRICRGFVWGGTFDFTNFLVGKIFEELPIYEKLLNNCRAIFEKYDEYKQKVVAIFEAKRLYGDYSKAPKDERNWFARTFGMSSQEMFFELKHYEENTFKRQTYNPIFPTVVLHLIATTQYDTYERDKTYNIKEIIECYDLALEKKGKMTFIQQQRAIVSDDMRYNVMKRDNFRCCICGATAKDGIKLEVDHIVPVSKGGKSTYDNLQTLCERCNKGKRDK